MSIDIPVQYQTFVRQAIASGRFESESAMVSEAMKLLVQRERELKLVEEGLDELDRGEYLEFDEEGLAQFFEEVKQKGRERLRTEGRTDV
jgi:putative addiction module CopG family antidote